MGYAMLRGLLLTMPTFFWGWGFFCAYSKDPAGELAAATKANSTPTRESFLSKLSAGKNGRYVYGYALLCHVLCLASLLVQSAAGSPVSRCALAHEP